MGIALYVRKKYFQKRQQLVIETTNASRVECITRYAVHAGILWYRRIHTADTVYSLYLHVDKYIFLHRRWSQNLQTCYTYRLTDRSIFAWLVRAAGAQCQSIIPLYYIYMKALCFFHYLAVFACILLLSAKLSDNNISLKYTCCIPIYLYRNSRYIYIYWSVVLVYLVRRDAASF